MPFLNVQATEQLRIREAIVRQKEEDELVSENTLSMELSMQAREMIVVQLKKVHFLLSILSAVIEYCKILPISCTFFTQSGPLKKGGGGVAYPQVKSRLKL